jgi:hypothetical protein
MRNDNGLTGEAKNPRIQGQVMVFEGRMKTPNGQELEEPKIYYAVVMEYCGNLVCGEGETNETCEADCPVVVDPPDVGEPDTGSIPDAGEPDLGEPDAGEPDLGEPDLGEPDLGEPDLGEPDLGEPDLGEPDLGEPDAGEPDLGEPDAGEPDVGEPDAGEPDAGEPDAGEPDANLQPPEKCNDDLDNDNDGLTDCDDPECIDDPACQPEIDPCEAVANRVSWVEGEELCNCSDYALSDDAEYVTIEGKCTIDVDLGQQNPVRLTVDGAYSIDFLNRIGEMLWGKYKVVDNGNQFGSSYSTSVIGVAGTTYEGAEAVIEGNEHLGYQVSCSEGEITISIDGKILATLSAGEDGLFDLVEGVEVVETEEIPDGGVVDGGTPDGGESDAGIIEPDSGTADMGTPNVPPNDSHICGNINGCGGSDSGSENEALDNGCSVSPNPINRNDFGMTAILLATLIASLRSRRRKEEK